MSNFEQSLPDDVAAVIDRYDLPANKVLTIGEIGRQLPHFLKKREAAEALSVAERTVVRLVGTGRLDVLRQGSGPKARIRVARAEVVDLLCRWAI